MRQDLVTRELQPESSKDSGAPGISSFVFNEVGCQATILVLKATQATEQSTLRSAEWEDARRRALAKGLLLRTRSTQLRQTRRKDDHSVQDP